MTFQFSDLIAKTQANGTIDASDVLALRQVNWEDGAINAGEADALFALNDIITVPSPEWCDFFVDALTTYTVFQLAPRGYVSEENATWLMSKITHDARVDTVVELELLVHVIEAATSAPDSLRQFALKTVEQTVLSGKGPTRKGGDIRPGTVDDAEVLLLRRLVFAPGGEGALIVGEDEADMLFRIKDATLGADNAAGWQTLFVQAVGNHLMALGNDPVPTAEQALASERFWKTPTSGTLALLGQVVRNVFQSPEKHKKGFDMAGDELTQREETAEEFDARINAANEVTAVESSWVRARMDADQKLDPLEEALIAFIEAEGRKIA